VVAILIAPAALCRGKPPVGAGSECLAKPHSDDNFWGYGVMIVIVRPRIVKAFIPVDEAFLQMTAMPLFNLIVKFRTS
jgi:hypothetical protein